MKRHAMVAAVAIAAAMGSACGHSSPTAPSSQPPSTPVAPSPSPAPAPAPLTDQQFKDRLEALILGTGPHSDTRSPGCFPPNNYVRWTDTLETMRVVMSTKTSPRQREYMMGVFDVYRGVLGGRPVLQEEVVDVLPPIPPLIGTAPRAGFIRVEVLDDLTRLCGPVMGCATGVGFDSTYTGGEIYLQQGAPDWIASHEAGHLIGMCHIIGIGAGTSIMSGATSPTDLDRRVLETVTRSGLRPGSTRSDFVARGLL